MSTGQTNVGDGGVKNTAYWWSGGGTYWTNWLAGWRSAGLVGRWVSVSAYWAGKSGQANSSGHNNIWRQSDGANILHTTPDQTVTPGSGGAGGQRWNTWGCADYFWDNSTGIGSGFWRPSNLSDELSTSGAGGYNAKSADDTTGIASGTAIDTRNMGTYATLQNTEVYVRRSGAWTRALVYVRRSGVWTTGVTWVLRSGTYTTVSELNRFPGFRIPAGGLPARITYPDGTWEKAWVVEGELEWVGSCDVTKLGIDWRQLGSHEAYWGGDDHPSVTSVRRYSWQTESDLEQIAEAKALRDSLVQRSPVTVQALWARSVEGVMLDGQPSHWRRQPPRLESFMYLIRSAGLCSPLANRAYPTLPKPAALPLNRPLWVASTTR